MLLRMGQGRLWDCPAAVSVEFWAQRGVPTAVPERLHLAQKTAWEIFLECFLSAPCTSPCSAPHFAGPQNGEVDQQGKCQPRDGCCAK